jgi:histidinol-phosphatase
MFDAELELAHELADAAAQIAVEVFQREFEVHTKPDLTPVTEADLRIEAMIRSAIADRFPADAVLGEEGGREGSGDRLWIVDPIDGTKNFAARIPVWATLVAFAVEDRNVLGVVGAPTIGERYEAVRGEGARVNGRSIHVSNTASLSRATVSTGGAGDWIRGPHRDAYLSLVEDADRVRGFGDFWGHMLVARGAVDVMMEVALRTWDWAALEVIVEEAGGRISQVNGEALSDGGSTISSNAALYDEVVSRFGPPRSR